MRSIDPFDRMLPRGLNRKKMANPPRSEIGNKGKKRSDQFMKPLPRYEELRLKEFVLGAGSFKVWSVDPQKLEELAEHLQHVSSPAGADDHIDTVLYESLWRMGFSMAEPTERLPLEEWCVYSLSMGSLLICLDRDVPLDVIHTMLWKAPEMIMFLN